MSLKCRIATSQYPPEQLFAQADPLPSKSMSTCQGFSLKIGNQLVESAAPQLVEGKNPCSGCTIS
ncbi:MAG: hypothetical protein R2825_08920 [Saprospiraceae bacterium]